MKRLLVLLTGLVLALGGASTSAAGDFSFSATGFGPQRPEEMCAPDPAEFLTPPTISGTPTVGSVLTTSSGNVYCADYLQASFFRTDSAGNIIATVRTGPVQSCSLNECTKTETYTVAPGDAGYYIKASWRVWNGYSQAVAATGLAGPVPPTSSPVDDLYGDNGEQILNSWSGGAGGNAWTVHQYANRYVIWTFGRGTYVVGRSVTGTPIPGHPNNYMGPGYIGQFSPNGAPLGKLLVNDALFVNFENPPVVTPRDGIHGGLGCFAVDFYRAGTLVDLNCRLLSANGLPGVYQVANESVSGDSLGVYVSMDTRYRDSTGAVFTVTYSHRFAAAGVTTTYTWQSDTNDVAYIKEPRIVAVLGTSDVPIYLGQGKWRDHPLPGQPCPAPIDDGTYGNGAGVWGLEPSLVRIEDSYHHWNLNDVVPWCQTVTVGPGATAAGRQYHRGGFSFNVVGVPRDFSVEDPGYNHDYDGFPSFPDTLNFNAWRRNSDGAEGIPGYVGPCVDPNKSPTEVCRMPICETCSANAWEVGRVPNESVRHAPFGQHGVFIAMEAWRASIGIQDYLGRARRLPASGTYYSETFKF